MMVLFLKRVLNFPNRTKWMYEHIPYKTANLYFSCFRKYGFPVAAASGCVRTLKRKKKKLRCIFQVLRVFMLFSEKNGKIINSLSAFFFFSFWFIYNMQFWNGLATHFCVVNEWTKNHIHSWKLHNSYNIFYICSFKWTQLNLDRLLKTKLTWKKIWKEKKELGVTLETAC